MQLRAPSEADAEAVIEVIVARDVADIGHPDYTLADLRAEWSLPTVELADDAVVAERDGRIVGYAIVQRRGGMIVVDPRDGDEVLGSELLTWCEARERSRGAAVHRQIAAERNASLAGLLHGRGYTHLRSYWRMARDVTSDGAPPPALPAGYSVRPPDLARDGELLHRLDEECFRDNADYTPHSFAEFHAEHLAPHDLAVGLSLVAEQDGSPAGFLLTRRWQGEETGFVDLLAIRPDHRRRGLASALLRTTFAACANSGLREVQLSVASDNPRAIGLYERAGMHVAFRYDAYERAIAG